MPRSPRYTSWLALLVAVLLHWPLAAVAHGETRHVLLLSSSERPYAPQSSFAETLIRDLVKSSREPIEFVEVSVQPARASGAAPDATTAQRIRAAFASHALDLVVTIGGPAATFAQQFRQELFPAIPVLIAGVDSRFVEHGTFTANETTVATKHDPALMIDEILRLLPDTRSVLVVVGASHVEQFWLGEMKREFRRFDKQLQFTWTNELAFAEIAERCRTMPAHSAIFFAILALDGKGEPQVDRDTMAALHAVANAPMFSLYGMGRGIVGGPLQSIEELSRTTTEVALRVLAGESPGSIQTRTHVSGQPTYDARELRRWKIDEARLPPASVVLFREPTIWQRYRHPLVWTGLLGLPALALVLFMSRRKRREAGNRDARANDVAPPGAGDTNVSVWSARADGERGPWTASVHPDDVERSREIYRRALEKHEPFQMEYRVLEGGVERWLLDTGVPKFSGKAFDGYVGSVVDITRLGRARAELSNLSRSLMQAHEHERAAIARTLHEDVCQRMMALTLNLHSLQGTAPDKEVQAVVADIGGKLARLVGDIAAVSDPVHQRLELLGLASAGRRFCEDLSARHEVAIHFEDNDVPRHLPIDVALAIFRV